LKRQKWIRRIVVTIIWLIALVLVSAVHAQLKPISIQLNNIPESAEAITKVQSYTYEDWRQKMRMCESSDNQMAINPNDLDGTPSYSLYQFKPPTFKGYVIKYDLFNWREWDDADWRNNLMSRWHQEEIMTRMIEDPDVKWTREFPDCIRKHGSPPVVRV